MFLGDTILWESSSEQTESGRQYGTLASEMAMYGQDWGPKATVTRNCTPGLGREASRTPHQEARNKNGLSDRKDQNESTGAKRSETFHGFTLRPETLQGFMVKRRGRLG